VEGPAGGGAARGEHAPAERDGRERAARGGHRLEQRPAEAGAVEARGAAGGTFNMRAELGRRRAAADGDDGAAERGDAAVRARRGERRKGSEPVKSAKSWFRRHVLTRDPKRAPRPLKSRASR
jgi:hypothetical protein